MFRHAAALVVLATVSSPAQTLNVSEDLVTLGIAGQNAVPDNPSLDARPLFQAALAYARDNGIARVVADPGAYWFLTSQTPSSYLVLDSLSDLTLDLQGSDVFLKTPFQTGIEVRNCLRVALANFTIDFMQLPFTQVRLTGVSGRTLFYEALPGWPSPVTLAGIRNRNPAEYWAMVFRNGAVPAGTNRLPLGKPQAGGSLQVNIEDSPWTQPPVLATYQQGDTIAFMIRSGDAPVLVAGGAQVHLSGIDVYSSGSLGVHVDGTDAAVVENVRVLPRPGTDRLISTNADGIHLGFLQFDTRVRRCYVTRTLDDGIALNSPFAATVDTPTGPRDLKIANIAGSLEPGYAVSFVDPNSGAMFGHAVIVAAGNATLSFDSDLPLLQRGFGLTYAGAGDRGAGTIVERNVVEDILFARGIFLGGVTGVTVRNNIVRRTNGSGIAAHYELAAFPTAPNSAIRITGNTVDSAIGPQAVGTGWVAATGAIAVLATDSQFQPFATPVTQDITVQGNFISNSGRSAIWMNGVDGGSVQGNTASGVGLYPQLAVWGASAGWTSQLTQDFTRTVVVRASRNVNVQP